MARASPWFTVLIKVASFTARIASQIRWDGDLFDLEWFSLFALSKNFFSRAKALNLSLLFLNRSIDSYVVVLSTFLSSQIGNFWSESFMQLLNSLLKRYTAIFKTIIRGIVYICPTSSPITVPKVLIRFIETYESSWSSSVSKYLVIYLWIDKFFIERYLSRP